MQDTGTWELREGEVGVDDKAIAGVMVAYLEWAHGRLLELYGVDDPPTDPRQVCQSLHEFRRPHGVLLLAESDGRPAAIGALRRLSDDVAEVKRMYVVPDFRGRHISSAILDRLIAEARAMGATTLRLDTCRFMSDAQRLYRSRGFAERDRYEGSEIPPRLQQHWVFFERRLDGATTTGAAPPTRIEDSSAACRAGEGRGDGEQRCSWQRAGPEIPGHPGWARMGGGPAWIEGPWRPEAGDASLYYWSADPWIGWHGDRRAPPARHGSLLPESVRVLAGGMPCASRTCTGYS